MSDLRNEMGFSQEVFCPIVFSKKTIAETYGLEAFNGDHLGWKARFNESSGTGHFQSKNYDLLLNYFVDPTPELLILSASVKANLKVGFPLEEKRLNNLEIHVDPKDYQLFAKELKKFL